MRVQHVSELSDSWMLLGNSLGLWLYSQFLGKGLPLPYPAEDVLDTLQSDCVEFRAFLLDLQRFSPISCDFQQFSTI